MGYDGGELAELLGPQDVDPHSFALVLAFRSESHGTVIACAY